MRNGPDTGGEIDHQSASTFRLLVPAEEAFANLIRRVVKVLHPRFSCVWLTSGDRLFIHGGMEGAAIDDAGALLAQVGAEPVLRRAMTSVTTLVIDHDETPGPAPRSWVAVPLTDDNGVRLGTIAAGHDRPGYWSDEKVAALEELAKAASLEFALRATIRAYEQDQRAKTEVLERISDLVAMIDDADRLAYLNDAAATVLRRMTGLNRSEALGRGIWALFPLAVGSAFQATYHEVRANHAPAEIELFLPGVRRWFRARMIPTSQGTLISLHDITESRLAYQELAWQAFHDPLTGLPNRALLIQHLERRATHTDAIPHALPRDSVAVIFIDLDDFKDVNDSYGHAAGDLLLSSLAQRLQQALREGDMAVRVGGDEFAILLDQRTTKDDAIAVARRIQHLIHEPFAISDRLITVTASLGVAVRDDGAAAIDALLNAADKAMYRAKRQGGGQVMSTLVNDAVLPA